MNNEIGGKMNRIKLIQLKKLGSAMALVLVALVMFLVVGAGLLSLGSS